MSSYAIGALETDSARWLADRHRRCDMSVTRIGLADSTEWQARDGRFCHRTGGFFSVVGVSLGGPGVARGYELPLVDQPEIGLLGFAIRRVDDRIEVLVQAKPEPGNIGLVQLAPSVQATESNYLQRHGGRPTPLLAWFDPDHGARVLSDSLQSEQGLRFLGKFNRNVVIDVTADDSANDIDGAGTDALQWLPFDDLQPLLLADFAVNTDARSVLATAPWSALTPDGRPFERWRGHGGFGEDLLRSLETDEDPPIEPPLSRLDRLRNDLAFHARRVPLARLRAWRIDADAIRHRSEPSFEVRQYRVTSSEREVPAWDQPLVAASATGTATLVCQRQRGVLRFLFSGRAEPGFREHVQFGPTTQSVDGPGEVFGRLDPREQDLCALAAGGRVRLACRHSDEGGRFFHSVSEYSIIELDEHLPVPECDTTAWLSLGSISTMIRRRGVFTNEARTLVSMLLALA